MHARHIAKCLVVRSWCRGVCDRWCHMYDWWSLLALRVPRMRRRLMNINSCMIPATGSTTLRWIQWIICCCVNHAIMLLFILYNIGGILLKKLVANDVVRLPIIPLPRLIFLTFTVLPVLTAPPFGRPLFLLATIAIADIMLKKHVVIVVIMKWQNLIVCRSSMAFIHLQLLFLLLWARLFAASRIGALMRVAMPIIRLVTRKTLLMLCLFNQVIYNILIKLELIKLILLQVYRDWLVVTVVIIKQVAWRRPRLIRLKTRIDWETMHAKVNRFEMRVLNQ